jgi:hypothetical protein
VFQVTPLARDAQRLLAAARSAVEISAICEVVSRAFNLNISSSHTHRHTPQLAELQAHTGALSHDNDDAQERATSGGGGGRIEPIRKRPSRRAPRQFGAPLSSLMPGVWLLLFMFYG